MRVSQFEKFSRFGAKNMVRCARCGPNFIESQQRFVNESPDRIEVPDGRDATNGKAGLRPDKRGVRFAQRLARKCGGFGWINALATGGQEQDGLAGALASEDDGFGDLIDVAPDGLCCIKGGAGEGRFEDLGFDGGGLKGCADTFQAFAHEALIQEGCHSEKIDLLKSGAHIMEP